MIKLTRIDHRLLHGQVAVAWANYLGADCILIANDDVAQSEFRKSTLRIAKPPGCKLVFYGIEASAAAINEGKTDKYKLFIVVETIEDARRISERCPVIQEINLGLSPPKDGAKTLGKAVYADDTEIEHLKAMAQNGIRLFIQQAPKDMEVNVNNMLDK